jgi:thiamine pyrophosphate-dependent acetolactate synthase large subunit-like protein
MLTVIQTREAINKFAETCGVPIFNTSKYASFTPTSPMLSRGTAGNLAKLPLLQLPSPDLIILLGARTGMFLGGRSGAIIPSQGCKLIQIDSDGSEIGRSLPVDLGIISDVDSFVTAMNLRVTTVFQKRVDKSWIQSVLSLASLESPFEKEPEQASSGALHPYHAMKHVMSAIEPGSIIVLDGGEASAWAGDLASHSQPSVVLTSTGYLGFLGNGFGYSLGCAIADPDRKVVNIQGDGSSGFHLMELDTYKRFNLNILTVIVNNSSWGMSSNGQDIVYGSKNPTRPASSLSPATEYDVVARGLQNAAAKVTRISDIQSTVAKLQAGSGPSCIDLIVDRKPVHPITTAMVGLTDDPHLVVVPYYDNIPRAYYKL